MEYKLAGIAICTLLIINVSAVLSISKEKVNNNGEERYYFFVDPLFQKEIKDIISDDITENELIYRITNKTNENLAPNPSFELGCINCIKPAGWTYSIDDKSKFHWDSMFSHTGGKSIGALNLTKTTRGSCWITTDYIPVDFVANSYEFSGWYTFIGTLTNEQFAAFVLRMYDEKFNYLGNNSYFYNFSSEWKYVSKNTSSYSDTIINEIKYVKLGLYQYYTQNEPNPLIEVRFDDIYFGFENHPPNIPTIIGKINGAIETSYNYSIQTTDPDQNDVNYYIDWGDNTHTITDLYESGEDIIVSHKWYTKGTYIIKIKSIDENYAESDWATLAVTMPCFYNTSLNQFWMKLQQRFPDASPILRHLSGH
jgi:hypothetical protein